MTKIEKKDVYILGQGTYGCAYKPKIPCVDDKLEDKNYISKVQMDDKTSKYEIEMGTLIFQN